MKKVKLATVWLDGCSGCHMSLLDMDAGVIALAGKVDVVYGPLVDAQEFPDGVDVTLVEGAVSSVEDMHKIQQIRQRTHLLISLGDCAVTANVPAMRNPFGTKAVYERAYCENVTLDPGIPDQVPRLLPYARPVHEVVEVDIFIPGCPPSADVIFYAVSELLHGRTPDLSVLTRFGA